MPTAIEALRGHRQFAAAEREYRATGIARYTGAFSTAEAARWAEEVSRLEALAAELPPDDPRRVALGSTDRADKLDPVAEDSTLFAALAEAGRLVDLASRILGEPVRVFKDKLIMKPPGSTGYGMHQDWPYWRPAVPPPDAVVTLVVAVDVAHAGNGALAAHPELHGSLLTPDGWFADPDPIQLTTPRLRADMAPGDVVFLHPLTPHGSPANASTSRRAALFLTYAARRYGDRRTRYYEVKPTLRGLDRLPRAMLSVEKLGHIVRRFDTA